MAKKFFYVCAGLILLALTYQLGARSATAQAPGNPIVGVAGNQAAGYYLAVAANGDCFATPDWGQHWNRYSNIFGSGPTATAPQTWGQVKDRYRR